MRKIPFFRQKNKDFCGPAVLQMVLAAYGIRETQDKIARQAGTNKKVGTTTRMLTTVLQSHGLRVVAGQHRSLSDIKRALYNNKIVIICWEEPNYYGGHYVMVRGLTNKQVILQDPHEKPPKQTNLRYPIKIFSQNWKDKIYTKTHHWAAVVDVPPSPTKT